MTDTNVLFPLTSSGGGSKIEGAVSYKGSVASASDIPASPSVGDLYIASAAFSLSGEDIEAKDMIIWNGTSWDVIQGNIESVPEVWELDIKKAIYDSSTNEFSFEVQTLMNGKPQTATGYVLYVEFYPTTQKVSRVGLLFNISSSIISQTINFTTHDWDLSEFSRVRFNLGNIHKTLAIEEFQFIPHASTIESGNIGYVTSDQINTAIGDIETLLAAL